MALKISKPTDYGVDATYWHIGNIQEDFKGGAAQLTLYGYTDEVARGAEKAPLAVAQHIFAEDNYVPERGREGWYNFLKQRADWQGAEDV